MYMDWNMETHWRGWLKKNPTYMKVSNNQNITNEIKNKSIKNKSIKNKSTKNKSKNTSKLDNNLQFT